METNLHSNWLIFILLFFKLLLSQQNMYGFNTLLAFETLYVGASAFFSLTHTDNGHLPKRARPACYCIGRLVITLTLETADFLTFYAVMTFSG